MFNNFKIINTILLFLILFTGCATTSTQIPTLNYEYEIDKILSDSIFDATQVGIKVISLKNNQTLYSKNEKLLFRPASNLKLITSSTALSVLTDTFNFETKIFYDSASSSIFIKGSGNPIFETDDLTKIISQLKLLGITQIGGNIVGDVSLFDTLQFGEGWMWDDEPFSYSAFNSPLTINNNCIKVVTTPSTKIGEKAIVKTIPSTSFVNIVNNSIINSEKSNLSVTRKFFERTNDIFITGNLNLNSSPDTTTLTVLYPEKYFLKLFYEELLNQGVSVKGNIKIERTPITAKLLVTHSQNIDSVIINFNKVSDNLTGENLLKIIGNKKTNSSGTTKAGIDLVNTFLNRAEIDTTKFLIADGSGLSHYNLVTAEILTKLLIFMANDKNNFNLFYNSLPIGGVDGTLQNRMKTGKAFNKVHAKTGSIAGVSSLSGYVTTEDNNLIVFSILMQNFIGSSEKYRKAQDKICEVLASINLNFK